MVLRIVRYLAQNGYGSEKLVVLMLYLGQLYNLQNVLKLENDTVLNNLDSFDLVKAGLLPAAAAKIAKNLLRLATIGGLPSCRFRLSKDGTENFSPSPSDNYQGEESDIVITILTRTTRSGSCIPQSISVSCSLEPLVHLGSSCDVCQSHCFILL